MKNAYTKILIGSTLLFALIAPSGVGAQTTAELQVQIQALLQQVQMLQKQLSASQGQVVPQSVTSAVQEAVVTQVVAPVVFDEDTSDDRVVQLSNLRVQSVSSQAAPSIITASYESGVVCARFESIDSASSVAYPCEVPVARTYHIKVDYDTILLLRTRARAQLSDFTSGNRINVYGFLDPDTNTIHGLVVRNLDKPEVRQYIQINDVEVLSVSNTVAPAQIVVIQRSSSPCVSYGVTGANVATSIVCPLGFVPLEGGSGYVAGASTLTQAVVAPEQPMMYPAPKKYVVKVTALTKILDRNRLPISLSDISVGDKLNVFGLAGSDGVIDASVVRDLSKPTTVTSPITVYGTQEHFSYVGESFLASFSAKGGATTNYKWGIQSGTLPPGLIQSSQGICADSTTSGFCSTNGVIKGVPTQAGVWTFVIYASDVVSDGGYLKVTVTVKEKNAANLPPVIHGVTAPTSLKVGETGTWVVRASDPENGSLEYTVNWGDENYLLSGAPASLNVSQTSTFTHSFSKTGTFNPIFTVKDSSGQSAKTSASVAVTNGVISGGFQIINPTAGALYSVGDLVPLTWINNLGLRAPFPVSITLLAPGTIKEKVLLASNIYADSASCGNGEKCVYYWKASSAGTNFQLVLTDYNGDAYYSDAFSVKNSASAYEIRPAEIEILVPQSSTVLSANNLTAGTYVTFHSGVINNGTSNAGVQNVKWFVDGVQKGYGSHEPVAAGAKKLDGNSRFDWKVEPGMHKIVFEVDSDNFFNEGNELDNRTSVEVSAGGSATYELRPVEIEILQPQTSIVMSPSSLKAGELVTFHSGVVNEGTTSVGIQNVKWYVDGVQKGYGSHEVVAAGTKKLDGNSRFDWIVEGGTHKITFEVDSDNFFQEGREYDNQISVVVNVPYGYDAPTMVYPQEGQVLGHGQSYMFKVNLVPGASGYLFGFFQNGVAIHENYAHFRTLSLDGEYAVHPDNPYYSAFKPGDLQVWVRALINNQWTEARIINIKLQAADSASISYDVDGDGFVQADKDGLLIMRYLFGFTGATLIENAVGTGATRNTAESISAYLGTLKSGGLLDVDGNGKADALTDGLLFQRYMAGMRGDTLISGAVGAGATRETAYYIEAFIMGKG